MAKNISLDTKEHRLTNTINDLKKKAKQERTNQITPFGFFPFPQGTADPTVPAGQTIPEGSMYYNTSTHKYRKYQSGAWSDTTI